MRENSRKKLKEGETEAGWKNAIVKKWETRKQKKGGEMMKTKP